MPNYTTNLNLVKPLVTEQYDIAKVTNDNADIIDDAIHDLELAKQDIPTVEKNTPIDADMVVLLDSADLNKAKKLSWANIKEILKTYFDTLYQSVLVSGTNIKTINGNSVLGSGDLSISSGAKNQIINGNFQVNQRAKTGTVTLTAGQYGHDRWKAGASGCTYTFATVENITTLTISAGSLIQVVEGLNLETGTYCLSWEGTAQGKIGAGSYGSSGITGSAVGGTNLNIEFNTGTLKKVSFVKGSTPVAFVVQPYVDELIDCQRYYLPLAQAGVGGNYVGLSYGMVRTSTVATLKANLFQEMRATPTLSASGIFTLHANNSTNIDVSIPANCFIDSAVSTKSTVIISFTASGLTPGYACFVERGNNTTGYIALNAEL